MVVTPVPTLLIYPTQELALPGFFRICPEWTQEVCGGQLYMNYQQKHRGNITEQALIAMFLIVI